MEERIWLLLELFISGQASANETGELVSLLHKRPDSYDISRSSWPNFATRIRR